MLTGPVIMSAMLSTKSGTSTSAFSCRLLIGGGESVLAGGAGDYLPHLCPAILGGVDGSRWLMILEVV